jgi:O-antigen ligase
MIWESSPYEQLPARLAAGAVGLTYCAGLVLGTPWMSRTTVLFSLLPMSAWLLWRTGLPSARDGGSTLRYWTVVASLAVYLAVLWTSTASAGLADGYRLSHEAWAIFLCIAAVASIGLAHRYDRGTVRYLGRWMSVAAVLASVMLMVLAIVDHALASGRLQGVPGINWVLNPNAVGGVFAICFAVVIGHGTSLRISDRERTAVLIGSLFPLAIVLMTQSRGAMLGCVVGGIVASLALPRRVLLTAYGVVAVASAAILLAFPNWVHLLLVREDSYRLSLWAHYLELSRAKPWLGYGLDYDVSYQLNATTIYTPHNILLAALIRGGLLGLVSLVVALAAALAAAIAAARRQWWLPLVVLVTASGLSSVDHELLPSTFSFYWYLFWLPLGLAAGAALAPADPPVDQYADRSSQYHAVPAEG